MRETAVNLGRVFRRSGFFYAPVPTYVSGVMALGWASDTHALDAADDEALAERFERAGLDTRWYTPAVHRAAFAQPPLLAALADPR